MAECARLHILGVPFHNVSFEETVAWAADRMAQRTPGGVIITPNLDFMYGVSRDAELRRLVFLSDLTVADGMPAVWLSGLFGPRLKERVTGSDLTPALLKVCAERGFSAYAIGGAPGVAERALQRMAERYPGLTVAGAFSPPMAPFEEMDLSDIGRRVRAASPHLVLVAMGMGKQERLMQWLRVNTDVPVMMGVGGSLDFLAGVQTRAPRWVQRAGIEWIWRMGTDPKRFIGRYYGDGVWLLGMLARLLALRAAAGLKRLASGGARPAGAGLEDGCALRLPELGCAAAQREFLQEARSRAWRALDLEGRDWLNSVELGAVAELEAVEGACAAERDIRLSSGLLERQLACQGLTWHGLVGAGARPFFGGERSPRPARGLPAWAPAAAGALALAGLALMGGGGAVWPHLALLCGGALLLGCAAARTLEAVACARRLREAVDRLRPGVVLAADAGGVVRGCSGGLEALLGYRREEVLGRPLGQLFAASTPFSPDAPERELLGRSKSGQEVPLACYVSPGGEAAELAVVQLCGLAARRRTECQAEALRRSLAEVGELYDSVLGDPGCDGERLSWRSWIRPGAAPGGDFLGCVWRGGDLFDFVLGDVSGKSEMAVLLGAASKYEILRAVYEYVLSTRHEDRAGVAGLTRMINAAVDRRLMRMGAYLTMGYIRFDLTGMCAEYVWRGAPPFFHWSSKDRRVHIVTGEGAAIGLQSRETSPKESRSIAPGDVLVFCSDGILFQRNAIGSALGQERVATAVERCAPDGDAQEVVSAVRALCEQWTGDGEVSDDMACLVTCVK